VLGDVRASVRAVRRRRRRRDTMNTVSVATSTRTHPVFAAHAHRVFFATPAGLVKDTDNLGDGVGLIEVHPSGATREVRKPVRRADPEPLPEHLVVEVFRRAARAEARVRTASDSDDSAAQVVALRASLATAERAAQTAREASRRDTGRGDLIRPLFGTWPRDRVDTPSVGWLPALARAHETRPATLVTAHRVGARPGRVDRRVERTHPAEAHRFGGDRRLLNERLRPLDVRAFECSNCRVERSNGEG